MAVLFQIDVYGPQGHPSSPPPSTLAYVWPDGGPAEFSEALAERSVFAYSLRGYGEHIATSRVYTFREYPDEEAAALIGGRERHG